MLRDHWRQWSRSSRLVTASIAVAAAVAIAIAASSCGKGKECQRCRDIAVTPSGPTSNGCDPGLACVNGYCVKTSCLVPARAGSDATR